MRQRVIQLALAVIAPADDRFDFSSARIESHERHLRLRNGFVASLLGLRFLRQLSYFFASSLSTFFIPVSTAAAAARCKAGSSVVYTRKFWLTNWFSEYLSSRWSFTMSTKYGASLLDIEVCDHFDRLALGVLNVGFGDEFVFQHLRQHAVAGLGAALGMPVGGRSSSSERE